MSIGIYSTPYSNAVNAHTANKKNPSFEQMQKQVQNPIQILNYDTLEKGNITILSDEEMLRHIEENRQIPIKHQQFFNTALTVEDTFSLYEKGREDILKTFENDRMLQVHLDVFDDAFTNHLRFLADNAAMVLRNEQSIVQAQAGHKSFEYNKIATHNDFNADEFQKNAVNLMSQYAISFIQQIKEGVDYTLAHKNATEHMSAAFSETASVNDLSFNDLSIYLKTITTKSAIAGLNPNVWGNFDTGLMGEKNNTFNSSTKISEKLQITLQSSC